MWQISLTLQGTLKNKGEKTNNLIEKYRGKYGHLTEKKKIHVKSCSTILLMMKMEMKTLVSFTPIKLIKKIWDLTI